MRPSKSRSGPSCKTWGELSARYSRLFAYFMPPISPINVESLGSNMRLTGSKLMGFCGCFLLLHAILINIRNKRNRKKLYDFDIVNRWGSHNDPLLVVKLINNPYLDRKSVV